ncbi:uncharacterized protein LOC106166625 [Lingula anatina]|uniref:Uncharacterized protein LOC106166625 n=1 Tax=Lingula anatina TaxID=7574 RepID=A0A1S3IRL7_LINAN|nr:uncharacterized protein LOC106166625 [Lingula anatina]|eukprot:XP_013400718.1 uncharacterized protein LOC106166625 [Lingula anatina]
MCKTGENMNDSETASLVTSPVRPVTAKAPAKKELTLPEKQDKVKAYAPKSSWQPPKPYTTNFKLYQYNPDEARPQSRASTPGQRSRPQSHVRVTRSQSCDVLSRASAISGSEMSLKELSTQDNLVVSTELPGNKSGNKVSSKGLVKGLKRRMRKLKPKKVSCKNDYSKPIMETSFTTSLPHENSFDNSSFEEDNDEEEEVAVVEILTTQSDTTDPCQNSRWCEGLAF